MPLSHQGHAAHLPLATPPAGEADPAHGDAREEHPERGRALGGELLLCRDLEHEKRLARMDVVVLLQVIDAEARPFGWCELRAEGEHVREPLHVLDLAPLEGPHHADITPSQPEQLGLFDARAARAARPIGMEVRIHPHSAGAQQHDKRGWNHNGKPQNVDNGDGGRDDGGGEAVKACKDERRRERHVAEPRLEPHRHSDLRGLAHEPSKGVRAHKLRGEHRREEEHGGGWHRMQREHDVGQHYNEQQYGQERAQRADNRANGRAQAGEVVADEEARWQRDEDRYQVGEQDGDRREHVLGLLVQQHGQRHLKHPW
mmetsp:Transcript_38620/g.106618  ORF Transcript_38620/g.106618 Transcript_38620/m.106618 type:complete len:315 (+) Transcript_38620:207-1151(+)